VTGHATAAGNQNLDQIGNEFQRAPSASFGPQADGSIAS
jgi:hypothetical protein